MSYRMWPTLAGLLVLLATAMAEAADVRMHAAHATPRRPPASADYASRPTVRDFIHEMARDHGFKVADLRRVFAAARFQPQIVEAMQRPLLQPPKWFEYWPRFLTPARIDGGLAFWTGHADVLARAEADYGVPPEIIVAIVGVETFYGRNTGRYRVIDALSTLAFDYPRRASFFRGELKHYLLLTRELGLPPQEPRGSFAGALGLPQFMPGSYRNFAVDFDGDRHTDLWASPADVVGSIANYLTRHDWQRDRPVLVPAQIAPASLPAILRRLDGGLAERRLVEAWQADGVAPEGPLTATPAEPVGLLLLEEGPGDDEASYWIAANNFYVLTRYNRSRLYATAVWKLAVAIRERYEQR